MQGRGAFTEIKALEDRFGTSADQRQIESLIVSLTIEAVRTQRSFSRVAALGVVHQEVLRLNAHFPKFKTGDAFRTQSLIKIVENMSGLVLLNRRLCKRLLDMTHCIGIFLHPFISGK